MSSEVGGLVSLFQKAGAQILENTARLENEKKELEARVSGLMQEVATLKQANTGELESSAREIASLKEENAELKKAVEKLAKSVAPLQQQVKDLTEFKRGLTAFIQNANHVQVEEPAPILAIADPETEIKAVNERLRANPTNPGLYLMKANLLLKRNDHLGAKRCFELAAINGIEKNSQFRQLAARNTLALGEHKEALGVIQEALAADATSGMSHFVEAEIYIAMGDKDHAKASAEKAKQYGVNIDKLNLR